MQEAKRLTDAEWCVVCLSAVDSYCQIYVLCFDKISQFRFPLSFLLYRIILVTLYCKCRFTTACSAEITLSVL